MKDYKFEMSTNIIGSLKSVQKMASFWLSVVAEILFIAPIYGKRKLQTLSSGAGKVENDTVPVNTSPASTDLKLLKSRLKSIEKRPIVSSSKTCNWTLGPKEPLLMLGWGPNVHEMIQEYDNYLGPGSKLEILSEVSIAERKSIANIVGQNRFRNIKISHKVGPP